MRWRGHRKSKKLKRACAIGLALSSTLGLSGPSLAQFLAPAFFDDVPTSGQGPSGIEADTLLYDAEANAVSAQGGVVFTYAGFQVTADSLRYNQDTGEAEFVGNVKALSPRGTVYESDRMLITGGLKQAVLDALVIRMPDGTQITASSAAYGRALETVLTDATYSPCGDCIDEQGRRIGWRVKAARLTINSETRVVYLEQPTLELLGIPVAWLPFISIPDPSVELPEGFRTPSFDYSDVFGGRLNVPYSFAAGPDTQVVLTPSLLSRQGILLGVEANHRFSMGNVWIKASGLYQLDRSPFVGKVGDRDWRGAIQSTGRFTPLEHWHTGWSYTAFTDAAYLPDYRETESDDLVNQVYATHLFDDNYFDIRFQQFNLLGEVTQAQQDEQALALPNARYEGVFEFPPGAGRIDVSARLLGISRGADQVVFAGGVPYVLGYEGKKVHAMAQAGWQNQFIAPGGVLFTPYLGVRGDAAYYDGESVLLPGARSLLSATPIAAVDMRWPLVADLGSSVHVIEPIAQLVYRGSDESLVGITNDDAQSFIFEDTNLFSYNRFTGSDRQETGLRLNVGGHYQVNLENGGYVDFLGGQSFHLGGVNGLGIADGSQVGNASGGGSASSYLVGGVTAHLFRDLLFGAKVSIDPSTWQVVRGGIGARYANEEGYTLDLDYLYLAGIPSRGYTADQHEILAVAGVPLWDYWRATAGIGWDIATNQWLEARAGLVYDDGYLVFGANYTGTGPTNRDANTHRFTATFRIKGPSYSFGF